MSQSLPDRHIPAFTGSTEAFPPFLPSAFRWGVSILILNLDILASEFGLSVIPRAKIGFYATIHDFQVLGFLCPSTGALVAAKMSQKLPVKRCSKNRIKQRNTRRIMRMCAIFAIATNCFAPQNLYLALETRFTRLYLIRYIVAIDHQLSGMKYA